MKAKALFNYAALALMAGALLHVIGLALGPEAIKFLGAPPEVVQSVADKTFYGPAITLAIGGLLANLAAWSLIAKTSSHKFLRFVLWVFAFIFTVLFAFIFTVRGLLIFLFVPAIMAGRDGGNPTLFLFHVGASFFVLTIGLALGFALYKTRKTIS